MLTSATLVLRPLMACDYSTAWQAMREFTDQRRPDTPDEIWYIEHPPVFTLGQNGKLEHVLDPGDIPVLPVDRGGQVTYHGPGQLMIYTLIDIRRRHMGVRDLVSALEHSIIDLLQSYGIQAAARCEAPGVYVNNAKICSIGLRIRRGCSYHGLALNVTMDLAPFSRINPCGYRGLVMTQLSALGVVADVPAVAAAVRPFLMKHLRYTHVIVEEE